MSAAPTLARGGLAPSHRRSNAQRVMALPETIQHVDWILVGATVAVSVLGVLMVYSATKGTGDEPTTFFLQRQALFVLIGLGLMAAVAAFDYRRLRDWAIPIAGAALFLLFGVLTPLGTESKGIQAWYELAGFQLQPAELAKLALIVGLAAFLTLEQQVIDGRRLAMILGVSAVPMALIMLQPDLGTVLVFGVTTLAVVFIAGARPRHFAVLLLIGIIGTVGILNSNVLAEYQENRLTSFLEQGQGGAPNDASYNQDQSQKAIGSGQINGQGLFKGPLTGLDFVPEQHTDFIFTVVGEELGLRRRGVPARPVDHHPLAGLADRAAGAGRVRDARLRRGAGDVDVPDVREHRDGHGDHAGDRHPAAAHVLRRVIHPDRVRRDRPRAERPHPPLQLRTGAPSAFCNRTPNWARSSSSRLARVRTSASIMSTRRRSAAFAPAFVIITA